MQGCLRNSEAGQEEMLPHQPVQGAVECAMCIQFVSHEEMKNRGQSDAAAQKKRRQSDDEVQRAARKYVLSVRNFLTHVLKSMP